jgi:uncharacterized protein YceH (UPF0502 family)
LLGALAGRDPAFVRELPRQPGKSVVRYDHLFYPADEPREYAIAPATAAEPHPEPSDGPSLTARVERLEAELAAMQDRLTKLEAR